MMAQQQFFTIIEVECEVEMVSLFSKLLHKIFVIILRDIASLENFLLSFSHSESRIMMCNVAKYDSGKVRLKPMQSAAFPFTVRDLQGGPLKTSRATVSLCIIRAVLLADCRGSFVFQRTFVDSGPFPKVSKGPVSCFH